jgi:dCTP diphosphatase
MAKNVIEELQDELKKFRDKRDWKKYHTPKDLSVAVTLEAAELIEHFIWKSPQEVEEYVKTHKAEIAEEVADVAIYLLNLCNTLNIDFVSAVKDKIKKNARKYPIEKSKGSAKKHTEF